LNAAYCSFSLQGTAKKAHTRQDELLMNMHSQMALAGGTFSRLLAVDDDAISVLRSSCTPGVVN